MQNSKGTKSKIFCIGLNKTGTTSLHAALKILDFSSVHYRTETINIKTLIRENNASGSYLLKGIEHFDAYSDWNDPDTNHLFKQLDVLHPGSKFIFTTRELEGWLRSREKHVLSFPELKTLRLNNPGNDWYWINKSKWRKEYFKHHLDVFKFFENRKQDLLVFDVAKGDGWGELCAFLEVDIPEKPFPKRNTAERRTPEVIERQRLKRANEEANKELNKEANGMIENVKSYLRKFYSLIRKSIDDIR
jgi:ribosomal protein L30/L7E